MGGATVPVPGGGVGAMAFPSAAEPNPILKGLRGAGPEQLINPINTPTGGPGGGGPPTNPTPQNPNFNFPTLNFGAPNNPGYYYQVQNGQLSLVPQSGQDNMATMLANTSPLTYNLAANQLGVTGGTFIPGTGNFALGSSSGQVNPQSELNYLQTMYPYQQPATIQGIPNISAGVQGYPNYWANSQMTQWKGPSVLGGQ